MQTRFNQKTQILDIAICAVSVMLSMGTTLYGVFHFGLSDSYSQLDLILNIFYIACVVMIWIYFFNLRFTPHQFNSWCSVCVGITVLLRDILFATPLENYYMHLACLTLSVLLLCTLTYFYARKEWENYTKWKLWFICIIDSLIAILYNIEIYMNPTNEYTEFFLTEIWIRPTITYGLVACFVAETDKK